MRGFREVILCDNIHRFHHGEPQLVCMDKYQHHHATSDPE